MSNRRDFLKRLGGSAALLGFSGIPSVALAKNDITKITILHTNDMHSHVEPFPENDAKYPGLGGMAQRAALINKIRSEEKNVLLFDIGDIFQGTPYFNLFGGELEMKLMSKMAYDAATIGNHDFDNGIEGLVKQLPHANFPFISSNYDFSDTAMHGKTLPYKIFDKEGIKIGVFGLGIELEGLVGKKEYGNTRYLDPMVKAAEMAHLLKVEMECDLVVCLSHLGYKYKEEKISDVIIAKKSKNIDLILGGHTHTFLDTPIRLNNRDGKEILVCQVGWAGIKLGRIDYYFEKNTRKKQAIGAAIKVDKKTSGI